MTRIIAGELRGRRLKVPDEGTRPTSDRVRESMFNVIGNRMDLDGARVLDLYAGSGALGFEALSRGAQSVTFVDNRRRASSVIIGNAATLGVSAHARVITAGVSSFLLDTPPHRFDLVLSDPPYALDDDSASSDLARIAHAWLDPDGLVVLERDVRSVVSWPDGLEQVVTKVYGDTSVQVARPS